MLRRLKCSAIFVEHREQPPGPLGLRPIQGVQQHVEVLRRRRHVRQHLLIERDDADAVALAMREVRQAGREELPVVELGHAPARERHRLRDVEQHREIGVGVRFVLLDEVLVGPRVQPPVHAADVVAGDVAAMLGEIDRRAEIRRAVQAVDEPVHDRPREQLEILDARKDLRIDEPRAGNDVRFHDWFAALALVPSAASYIPDLGSGTRLSSSSISASLVTPSDSARKLRQHAVTQHGMRQRAGCRRSSRGTGPRSTPWPWRRESGTARRGRSRRTPRTS